MEKKKHSLTVALAVYNEERTLSRCLESVRAIADEIIVVDGGSSDGTIPIAQKYGANIIRTDNPPIFHINKQKALDASTSEWILQLDADEVLTPELASEINEVLSLSDDEKMKRMLPPDKRRLFLKHQNSVVSSINKPKVQTVSAYFIPRLNYFLGGPIRYAGTYPDGVIRLVKNGYAQFPMQSVHEQIETEGIILWLEHDLIHFSNNTVDKYVKSAGRYTNLMADSLVSASPNRFRFPVVFAHICIMPLRTFFSLYIRHKGFLDGWRGFVFSLFSSLHFPVIAWKYIRKFV